MKKNSDGPKQVRTESAQNRKWIALALFVVGCIVLVFWLAPSSAPVAETPKQNPPPASAEAPRRQKDVRAVPVQPPPIAVPGIKTSLTNIQYVFDRSRASGTNRCLVATKWDSNYRPESDSPSGREMWVTDQFGNERLVHSSVFRAKFSPDGSKIAYTSSDCVMHVETLDGKPFASVNRAFDPCWRPDGDELLFVKVPDGIEMWPAEAMQLATFDYKTGSVRTLTEGKYDDVLPSYSPNSKYVLFVSGGRSGWASFYVVPIGGGQPVELTNRGMQIPVPYDRMFWSQDGQWFIYDSKDGDVQETWALRLDENGQLKTASKIADALDPQLDENGRIMCTRQNGEKSEPVLAELPSS